MRLEDIVIILARPSEPGNVGAVCRAMKNMGLGRLRLAAPELGDREHDRETLLARAVHAADVWEGAERFDTLEAALADCALTVGITRRRGRHRKSNSLNPRELALFLKEKSGPAALVFGNERTGLDDEELSLCNMASHIPVSPDFPSLNLSHAVQIYAYELFLSLHPLHEGSLRPPGQWIPMTREETDSLVRGISASLSSIGFYKHPGREEQERFLRDLITRAGLSVSEGRYLGNIISKAGRLAYSPPLIRQD
jgi:tRNA/rRNA methyltransferase/tRNA (cytidine32/uridine32-2'-O)-methyltransferase